MIVPHKSMLPEKPIRLNTAGRLANKISKLKKKQTNKHIHVHSAGIQID